MARRPMDDLIIVLPGILGSVLNKGGKPLWGPALSAIARTFQRDALGNDLLLRDDDPTRDIAPDGVTPAAVMPDIHLLPGFWKIDGYETLLRFLEQEFAVTRGSVENPHPKANLFPFPYDWRRDNRISARRLRDFVARQLPIWRANGGSPDAEVILIGHSMGGLISRYYLEVLGGWQQCKALFTLGTPHRGSLDALNFLSNGKKILRADVTEAMRSFPSVHQLLPTYRVVIEGQSFDRVSQLPVLDGLNQQRIADALSFHGEIAAAASERLSDPQRSSAYLTVPVVGIGQPTFQSATIQRGRIVTSTSLTTPARDARIPEYGDGTVPFFSAIPEELATQQREIFVAELHASIQSHQVVLTQIRERLSRVQQRDWRSVLGPGNSEMLSAPALSMKMDDLFHVDKPVTATVRMLETSADPEGLVATIVNAETGGATAHELTPIGTRWHLKVEGLPAGAYRVEVATRLKGEGMPDPVNDLFEIVERV